MTDYRSVEELWVYRESERVGSLRRLSKGCEFRYTDEFLGSSQSPIALHLPKATESLLFEGLANLPTYFAGLLPEGVMLSAVRRLIGGAADDLFAILAATGADAIGDIDVRIPGERERTPAINLADAVEQIDALLTGGDGFNVDHLAAIAGAQPKLSLGELVRAGRTAGYIAKFDTPEFSDLTQNEYAMMRLGRLCRLNVPECKLQSGALVVRRFDRVLKPQAKLLAKVHVEDMLQVMDLFPNSKYSMEYVDLLAAMDGLGVSLATLMDALELYAFSYIIGNGDLHAKNASLVRDKNGQWRLSPLYDLLTTLPYRNRLPGADRMALALSDDNFGRFTPDEFIEVGERFRLPAAATRQRIRRIAGAVLKHLPDAERHYLTAGVAQVVKSRAESLQV